MGSDDDGRNLTGHECWSRDELPDVYYLDSISTVINGLHLTSQSAMIRAKELPF